MQSEQFVEVVHRQMRLCEDVLVDKAREYATEDRLHNFKIAAALGRCSPRRALSGMMAKHTVSIFDMCRSHETYPMELWSEKITDSINYLLLLRAVIEEDLQPEEPVLFYWTNDQPPDELPGILLKSNNEGAQNA